MGEIKAGIVLVSEFCKSSDDAFTGYIDYIDRDEAVRAKANERYNIFSRYNDYMDEPEKMGGLFTEDKDYLTEDEKQRYKEAFSYAQEKGSLMWQSVFSFDHSYLKEIGALSEDNVLNDRLIKMATRAAMQKMLKAEGLENAIYTASIHYNTDNIHVHISTVEIEPMRQAKYYIQYETYKDAKGKIKYVYKEDENGVRSKIPLRDKDGNIIKKLEYKGKFKASSLRGAKAAFASELLKEISITKEIDELLRDKILSRIKDEKLKNSYALSDDFLNLYSLLPKHNLSILKYNSSKMKSYRKELDNFSKKAASLLCTDDMKALLSKIDKADKLYKMTYGESKGKESYKENKIKSLYERLGNIVLKQIAALAKHERENGIVYEQEDENIKRQESFDIEDIYDEGEARLAREDIYAICDELIFKGENIDKRFIDFKNIKRIYEESFIGERMRQDILISKLKEEAEKGNLLAIIKLADTLHRKREIDASKRLYKEAYNRLLSLSDEKKASVFEREYAFYMLGKMNYFALCDDKNIPLSEKYFKYVCKDNKYASFYLGKIYSNEENNKIDLYDIKSAYMHFKASENPFAYKDMLNMIRGGKIDDSMLKVIYKDEQGLDIEGLDTYAIEKDIFDKAYKGFLDIYNDPYLKSEHALYNLAKMSLDREFSGQVNTDLAYGYIKEGIYEFESVNICSFFLRNLHRFDIHDKDCIKRAEEIIRDKLKNEPDDYIKNILAKLYIENDDFYNPQKAAKLTENIDSTYASRIFAKAALKEPMYISKALEKMKNTIEISKSDYDKMLLAKLYLRRESDIYSPYKAADSLIDISNEFAMLMKANICLSENIYTGEAMKLLKELSNSKKVGNTANIKLGYIYLKGEIVKKDTEKAKEYFKKAEGRGQEIFKHIVEMEKSREKYMRKASFKYRLKGALLDLRGNIKRAIADEERSTDDYLALKEYEKMQDKIISDMEL